MLDLMDILKMMAEGGKLPQQKHPQPSGATIEAIQEAEPELLNSIFRGMEKDEDPVDILMAGIGELTKEHGWFATTTILCMCFAQRFAPETIPPVPDVTEETLGLLRMFSLAAGYSTEDDGAWTIPLAILTDLGEGNALGFTACAGLCAGVGHIQSDMETRAQGEGS